MALGKGLSSLIPQQKNRSAENASSMDSDRVWHIPLTKIRPNSEQPRKHFSHQELEDLMLSIKAHGILQPITVVERPDGGYELIAGERRLRASEMLGLPTIPAMVHSELTDQGKLEVALIENIQRQDLNPIEEAFAYKRLTREFGMTQEQVAQQVGKSRPVIANTIRLLDLPEIVQTSLIEGKFSVGKARVLLSLKDQEEQLDMFESMVGEKVTVRDTERMIAKKSPESRKGSVRRDPNILAQEQLLEERFGTKVHIAQKGEKGTITFYFYSKEELKKILSELA